MNCPKCGLPTVGDQKFCRTCGASLQLVTKPLPERTIGDREPAIISKYERQVPSRLVLWGFIMMFLGVAMGVVGKKLLHQDIVTTVGILVSLAGMFLTVYPYLLPAPRKKYDSLPSSRPEVLKQSQPTKHLPTESNTEFVPSITERTTDLLKESVKRPNRNEDGETEA